jgi:hypothetical protein
MSLAAHCKLGSVFTTTTIRQLPGEIVEDAQQIPVQVGSSEFVKVPRLGFGLAEDVGSV